MEPRLLFRPRHRLTHAREFQAVYDARVSRRAGPLVVHTLPNDGSCPRLGLSVGRRVGPAHVRVAVKRRLREAFRALQHGLPRMGTRPYDVVISVHPHSPLTLGEYQQHLDRAVRACHQIWTRRQAREEETMRHDGT